MSRPGDVPVSPAASRYLEAMFYIRAEEGSVRAARLADWLGVSAPSVSESLHRMERDGLVELAAGHALGFTALGQEAAARIVRRHRIVEVWLTESLGFDWVSADEEAHRIAHTLSGEVLERLHSSLGRPRACPHGNQIPGEPETAIAPLRLAQLGVGDRATVRRVSEVAEHESPLLLGMLDRAGVRPGKLIQLTGNANDSFGIRVEPDGGALLSASAAHAVWVEHVPAG